MKVDIRDHPGEHRYELYVDEVLAAIEVYHVRADTISLMHTEVFDDFAGRGLAPLLVIHVLGEARERGLSVLPICPYVAGFIKKNADDYLNLVPESRRSEFGL